MEQTHPSILLIYVFLVYLKINKIRYDKNLHGTNTPYTPYICVS